MKIQIFCEKQVQQRLECFHIIDLNPFCLACIQSGGLNIQLVIGSKEKKWKKEKKKKTCQKASLLASNNVAFSPSPAQKHPCWKPKQCFFFTKIQFVLSCCSNQLLSNFQYSLKTRVFFRTYHSALQILKLLYKTTVK